MKWNFTLPYTRDVDSLLHYPEVSQITGKAIDWRNGEPSDDYEAVRLYGEHTLELRNLPYGRTPEYMQERLRRFFSKFGPVVHCRAEPHSHDPYQCSGEAYVSFRDRRAALTALKAPLKFPASLHDKVISMRHVESGKRNDPDYYEKSKFWNRELVAVARQLHVQLLADPVLRSEGKPLFSVGSGLLERELVPGAGEGTSAAPLPRGRAGVPFSKGLTDCPTRLAPAGGAVIRRFGAWEAFLAEPPFDELFALDRKPRGPDATSVEDPGAETAVVVRPRLVSAVQRARLLTRAKLALSRHLHKEFSVWWREGRVPLPEYTQRRITWWDHKPKLSMDLQILSRHKRRVRVFDERFLYRQQLLKARNERRRERRAEWGEQRKKHLIEQQAKLDEKRHRALMVVEHAERERFIGRSSGLVAEGTRWKAGEGTRWKVPSNY